MSRLSRLLPGLAAPLLAAAPQAAHACSVCFSANAETRDAFVATTVFLSVLPLSMIGGIGVWVWRRVRAAEVAAEAARAPLPVPRAGLRTSR